jgi:hypothetical protein
MPRGRPSRWACIVVCPLWLEIPLRAALIVAAPHFTHVPFRIRENLLGRPAVVTDDDVPGTEKRTHGGYIEWLEQRFGGE